MRVLINRSDAIGDTLLTLPMAKLLKEYDPKIHITFIVSKKSINLFANLTYVDEIIEWKDYGGTINTFWSFFNKLKKCSADAYFYVGGSHMPSLIAKIIGIKFRGGLKSRPSTFFLLNRGVRQKRSLVEMHESDYNLNLLAPLGVHYDFDKRNNYRPEIILTEKEIAEAMLHFTKDLASKAITYNDNLIFIHPGMSGHTLNWPSRNYARVISRLERRVPGKYIYVVSYTPADQAYLKVLNSELEKSEYDKVQDRFFFFVDLRKELGNYMSVLSKGQLFIGPSTGTTHIANSLKIKTVAIYSPIKVQSAMRWGPFDRTENHCRVVVPDVICGEQFACLGTECPYYDCMMKIEVDDVAGAAL